MKRNLTAAILAATTALAMPALAQERGGTLNFARYDGSRLIDPIYADRNPDIWMVGSLFDTLLRSSDDGKSIVGGLAESFEVSEDGKTVTLMLQDGLKFSDGSALDAEDVLYSLGRARNADLGPWAGMLGNVSDVTADGNTITVSLSQPDPTILSMLATFNTAIVNKDVFDAAAGATDQEKSAAVFAAGGPGVGSGAFYLCRWWSWRGLWCLLHVWL
jgi:peptide/nickel transport system substrate-binding protein